MNPYEKTAEEMKRQSEGPKRLAKTAIGIGSAAATAAGASAFAPILARAAPFLSQYIPENLAIQGLSKVHPKLGKFVKTALSSGYDFGEVKNFIGNQIKESQATKEKDNRNIIEQESPELHQFIDQEIKKGRRPIEAAAIAQHNKQFSPIIDKLSKTHKIPWSSIIESVYGNGEMAQNQQSQQNQKIRDPLLQALISGDQVEVAKLAGVNNNMALKLIHNFNQQQQLQQPQQPQQAQQQLGQGQQALMAILQKINQRLGK